MSQFIQYPSNTSGKVPVYADAASLPPAGNTLGDLALTADTGTLYEWRGSSWIALATPTISPNAIDGLTGDVSASGPGVVAAVVNSVGGASAADIAAAVTQSQAATSSDTPSTLVLRDGSGDFAAGTITASLTGHASLDVATSSLGNLTDAGTDGITVTGGTGSVVGSVSLSQHVSDSTHNGYLSSTDWSTFNAKQAAGSYITALTGDGTASGPGSAALTFATVNSNVGSFGSSTSIPNFTVNAKGLVTAAGSNVVIAPAGTLTGTTLNSTVVTSSLTSVGTITSGTWSGTTVAVLKGGTGVTTSTGSGSVVLNTSPALVTPDLGTPTALVGTNISGTAASLTAGHATAPTTGTSHGAVTLDSSGNFQSVAPGSSGNVLKSNGTDWVSGAGGTGTVTSVGITGTSIITWSNTPVTTTGTLTATLTNQNAGTYLAGPYSGSATTPSFKTFQPPTIQVFTSSSGTYTTPAGALYIKVKMVGGGGGGAGSGGSGSTTSGAGGNTTFGSSLLTANGGAAITGGSSNSNSLGGVGGTATVTTSGTVLQLAAISGGSGGGTSFGAAGGVTGYGGMGAASPFGGAGGGSGGFSGVNAGGTASTNSGSGGGGASMNGTNYAGPGGGAGGYVESLITSPSATYAYAVGAAGTGGSAGSGGAAGGNGGSGIIIVEEHYQ